MFDFFQSAVIIFLFIIFSSVFLFVLFVTMLSRTNRKHEMSPDASMKVAKENRFECAILGFARALPKGEPLPNECISCPKLVKCMVAKEAFDWYIGRKSAQNSKNERINRTETPKHIQE